LLERATRPRQLGRLCELVWVLSRAYRYAPPEIAGVIEKLLQTAELDIEDADIAWQHCDSIDPKVRASPMP